MTEENDRTRGSMSSVVSLHRYWIYSNRLRVLFKGALKQTPMDEMQGVPVEVAVISLLLSDLGIFMAYWYGSLYVVVEGYRELRLNDPEIDILLQSPNVDHLRLFRNGMFHFQQEPLSPKLFGIMNSPDSVAWLQRLHRRLGEVLLSRVRADLPPEARENVEAMLRDLKGGNSE